MAHTRAHHNDGQKDECKRDLHSDQAGRLSIPSSVIWYTRGLDPLSLYPTMNTTICPVRTGEECGTGVRDQRRGYSRLAPIVQGYNQ